MIGNIYSVKGQDFYLVSAWSNNYQPIYNELAVAVVGGNSPDMQGIIVPSGMLLNTESTIVVNVRTFFPPRRRVLKKIGRVSRECLFVFEHYYNFINQIYAASYSMTPFVKELKDKVDQVYRDNFL